MIYKIVAWQELVPLAKYQEICENIAAKYPDLKTKIEKCDLASGDWIASSVFYSENGARTITVEYNDRDYRSVEITLEEKQPGPPESRF